ncbi:protein FAM32A-like [Amphiura filiformis]|uniref:protein FAM32A-like n=1 Tax=Amphiura filiformis TaxID=82378 RepID=UPI003B218B4A
MSAYQSAGGALKLKGIGDLGNKKKKKKKKEAKKVLENISMIRQSGEDGEPAAKRESNNTTDKRTPAEKAFAKVQQKRQTERVLEKASKKHKDRVEEFNGKLDSLTEHFDIPKVSWTK